MSVSRWFRLVCDVPGFSFFLSLFIQFINFYSCFFVCFAVAVVFLLLMNCCYCYYYIVLIDLDVFSFVFVIHVFSLFY